MIVVNDSVVFAELDEEAVLLDVESGVYFGLDAIGARIWSLLSEGSGEEEIVASLVQEYDAPTDQLRADVSEFIGILQSKSLVKIASPDATG